MFGLGLVIGLIVGVALGLGAGYIVGKKATAKEFLYKMMDEATARAKAVADKAKEEIDKV